MKKDANNVITDSVLNKKQVTNSFKIHHRNRTCILSRQCIALSDQDWQQFLSLSLSLSLCLSLSVPLLSRDFIDFDNSVTG